MKLISIAFLFYFCLEIYGRKIKKSKVQKTKKTKHSEELEKQVCLDIYAIGEKFNSQSNLPKYKPSDFSGDFVLFTKINLNKDTGIFKFNFNQKDSEEYKLNYALCTFFSENQFPPKYNWFDLKGCCLKLGKFNGKEIFKEVCYNLIFGFIQYRYFTMVIYIEKAFVEGMENLEYVVGEIPLTDEQKLARLDQKLKNPEQVTLSTQWMKAKNPIYVFKGGKKKIIDKDNYDFLTNDYFVTERNYIIKLKAKLATSCALSVFIPIGCSEYFRICPFLYDENFNKFVPNAKELSDNSPGSKTAKFKDHPDYFSFTCLTEGYILVCGNEDSFVKDLNKEILGDEIRRSKQKGTVSEDFKIAAIKCYYFGSVTATSDLDFTIVTFQNNMLKNYHLQRIIVDNFNHRFQNDMVIRMKGDLKNKCYTSGDCLDTNAYMTGFMENKFDSNTFTGLQEIDQIFNLTTANQNEFREESFITSASLGMMALVEFWKVMVENRLAEKLDVEYKVNYQEGIINDIQVLSLNYIHFLSIIKPLFQFLNTDEKYPNLAESEVMQIAKLISDKLSHFTDRVEDDIHEIREIKNRLNKQIELIPGLSKYQKSVKLNEGYTLLTLEAIEEITHIQPSFASAMEYFKKFTRKEGAALMYANEAYYNNGGIKFQTKKKKDFIPCSTSLEAAYMIMGYDLLHYFELYPFVAAPLNLEEEVEGYSMFNHGDALLKLAKYFKRVLELITNPCKLFNKNDPIPLFLQDFQDLGFENNDLTAELDEVGSNYIGPTPNANFKKRTERYMDELYDNVDRLRVMIVFSKLAINLKDNYGKEPLELYTKVIQLEKNVLIKFQDYNLNSKPASIAALVRLSSFILNSMTFSYYITQKIWDFVVFNRSPSLSRHASKVEDSQKQRISFSSLRIESQKLKFKKRFRKKLKLI